MAAKMKFDFGGYATKCGLKCSDGRTIQKNAFQHQDGQTVPLVYAHNHTDPSNVLGHAVLENRADGVYCYGVFNNTPDGQIAKELVKHGDIQYLSIYANQLQQTPARQVQHGEIREVSLVLAGANPGARIDNLSFAHADGSVYEDECEVIIHTGLEIDEVLDFESEEMEHTDMEEKDINEVLGTLNDDQKEAVYMILSHALAEGGNDSLYHAEEDNPDETIEDIFNTLSEKQKKAVYFLIGTAVEGDGGAAAHYDDGGENAMYHNVFDQNERDDRNTLSHDQMKAIIADGKKYGTLKDSFLAHADDYGFEPIDILFPDARLSPEGMQTFKRDDGWVSAFLAACTHSPFARIKTIVANITADEARAKGYVKASLKKEQVVALLKRTTTPTTIYKKQKIDRDDLIDITDFDVVMWLRAEMRGMLDEELARTILIGDGRDVSDEDKINEQNIRPIALDNDDMYVFRKEVEPTLTTDQLIDEFIRMRKEYKGSGSPKLYTSTEFVTEMQLIKDSTGRRIYSSLTELASLLRVSSIEEIELLNDATRVVSDTQTNKILGIVVNPKDYTIGADKGGQVNWFDDFNIDYNQQIYLIETRVSGALTKPRSALILEQKPQG